jgi:hypothetical protein
MIERRAEVREEGLSFAEGSWMRSTSDDLRGWLIEICWRDSFEIKVSFLLRFEERIRHKGRCLLSGAMVSSDSRRTSRRIG